MNEYSLMAGIYDLLLAPFLRGMRNRVIEISKSLKPETILDLCCGTGNQLKLLSKAGLKNLTGIDLSEEMLYIAKKGTHAPECLLRDALETGLADNSLDLAMISLALHEKTFEQASSVLTEAHRILKPGAVIIVSDYTADKSAPVYASAIIRFIEYIVGGEHFINYKDYLRRGGLPGLCDIRKYKIIDRYPAAAGGISVEVWEKLNV